MIISDACNYVNAAGAPLFFGNFSPKDHQLFGTPALRAPNVAPSARRDPIVPKPDARL